MELAGQRFVVTGGAGFIGSHLVDALLAQSARVVVLDDLSYGSLDNLADALPRIEFLQASILDANALDHALKDSAGVFHLAAVASVLKSIDDPVQTHEINSTGTLQLFEIARKCRRPPKIVFSSSAAVYGDDPVVPKRESMQVRPVNPYGTQKLLGELYLANYHHVHGLSGVSLRYFNVYGPRQTPTNMYSGVVSAFCDRVKRGAEVTINGDGGATRDFVFVADVARANLDAMLSRVNNATTLNIGTGRRTSILDLAKMVHRIYGKEEAIVFGPERPGDIRHSYAEISEASAEIGFKAAVELSQGLARAVGR